MSVAWLGSSTEDLFLLAARFIPCFDDSVCLVEAKLGCLIIIRKKIERICPLNHLNNKMLWRFEKIASKSLCEKVQLFGHVLIQQ